MSRYKSDFPILEKRSTFFLQDRANEQSVTVKEACVTVNIRCCTENDELSGSKTTYLSTTTNRGPIPFN